MEQTIESEEEDYLYIQKSQISDAGMGLFTAIDIFKDEIISIFKGEVLSQKQAKIRVLKKEDKYFMNLPNGLVFDTSLTDCFAKYANDAEGFSKSDFTNNSIIKLEGTNKICLVAKRKIKAGEEIFCAYGKKYWDKHK
jgi:SET domain-containing protein